MLLNRVVTCTASTLIKLNARRFYALGHAATKGKVDNLVVQSKPLPISELVPIERLASVAAGHCYVAIRVAVLKYASK